MGRLSVGWTCFLLAILVGIVHLLWVYPQLPERLATHFAGSGRANGWSSRDSFVATSAAVLLLMGATFGGLAWWGPRIPPRLVSLPNRDYWLAPERAAATWHRFAERFLVLGTATVVFLSGIVHLTARANLADEPRLGPGFWILLVAYLVFSLGWSVWLAASWRLPRRP